jgi:hypothetical protein
VGSCISAAAAVHKQPKKEQAQVLKATWAPQHSYCKDVL